MKALEAGSVAQTKGTVVVVNSQSFLIKDATGTILVYQGSNWTADVKVGDVVTVDGTTALYGGAMQFAAGTAYTVTGTETVDHGTPVELTTQEYDAYANMENVESLFIKMTGVLTVSSGKYFNVALEGATITGSISYPVDKEALTALDGTIIEVIGYITNVTGSGKYLNVMAVSVNGDGIMPEPKPEPEPNPTEPGTIVASLIGTNSGWESGYSERVVESNGLTVNFSRVSSQTTTITDCPVIAASSSYPEVYAIVSGFGGTLKSATFELLQWNTKTLDAIYIEYTLDGSTWVKCSSEIQTPETLKTTELPEGVLKVRLVVKSSNSKNTQVALKSVTIVSE